MSWLLTADEIRELTGLQRPAAQCRALDTMGIIYLVTPDGHPRVLRALVERLAGAPQTVARPEPELELCFEPRPHRKGGSRG